MNFLAGKHQLHHQHFQDKNEMGIDYFLALRVVVTKMTKIIWKALHQKKLHIYQVYAISQAICDVQIKKLNMRGSLTKNQKTWIGTFST